MTYSTKLGLLILVTLTLLFFTCRFAISDVLYPDRELLAVKPWRPMARMLFGATMVPIILIFARWLRATLDRNHHGG